MTDDAREHERSPEDAQRSIRQEITRMFGEQEPKLDGLFAEDAALPPPPVEPKPRSTFVYVAPILLVIGIVGIVFRLVFLPVRGVLRRQAERREVARLDAQRLYLRDAYDKIERDPTNVETRINLAVMLATYDRALAERLLDEAVRSTEPSSKLHPIALHNRGLVRTGLHLERLGRADAERAKQLGFTLKRPVLLPGFMWFVFKLSAGLIFD
jgi:hypothetical protein